MPCSLFSQMRQVAVGLIALVEVGAVFYFLGIVCLVSRIHFRVLPVVVFLNEMQ